MTAVWLLIGEVKRNAHAGRTPEQGYRYLEWVVRAERSGRITPTGPITLAGNDWAAACDTREDAEWLARWLIGFCGFRDSMLHITTREPETIR